MIEGVCNAMPTYEFQCKACEKDFSLILSIRERSEASVRCPACGSERVEPKPTLFVAKTAKKS